MPHPQPEAKPRFRTFWGRAQSFQYAGQGVAYMLRTQHNAWIHAAITLAVIASGFAFGVSAPEWCWLILAMASVWTAESFNTAIEIIVDMASPEWRPAAGRAKDVAAGAVLLCAAGASVVGLLIFLPRAAALVRGLL
ncbi:MAG TPA: diacylglycerol kinase family protein [Planctomycetota bacterium]|nr:diacylglycerol kinase family protein [Planctomycetota bacterium]HRR81933.1 diacylglycerol kinase family protein [Planctomycetota bacterium]HRT94332.1 diacylglycerol kinase family protein [Planctomycetota bacterium]